MKLLISAVSLAAVCNLCAAQEFRPVAFVDAFAVERMPFGSGTPAAAATTRTESAEHVVDDLYHVPNYLPGFPTAATIWPREVPIECERDPATGEAVCGGYRVHPAVGRGEYIFVRPAIKVAAPPPPPAVIIAPCSCCRCVPQPPAPLPKARKKPLG